MCHERLESCVFEALETINTRPEPFEFYTAEDLWADQYTSEQMLKYHLNEANQLNGFWSPNRYYGFVNTYKYEAEKVVLDKYTIVEASRTLTVYNWLQYFNPDRLEKELVEGGFRIEMIYCDVAGSPFDPDATEFAVVARKT
jgi:hypothetical protein